MPKSFTIPFPRLSRVHTLDQTGSAVEDLNAFFSQYISLVILADFPGESEPKLLKIADSFCTGQQAHPDQRVLWIPQEDLQDKVRPVLEEALKAGFGNEKVIFENLAALSLGRVPATGKARAAYLIYKDPSHYPEDSDKERKLNMVEMKLAFNYALKDTI
jgi:hypothetical protein